MTLTSDQIGGLIILAFVGFASFYILGAAHQGRSKPGQPVICPQSPGDLVAQLDREVPKGWRWSIARTDRGTYYASISFDLPPGQGIVKRSIDLSKFNTTTVQEAITDVLRQFGGVTTNA